MAEDDASLAQYYATLLTGEDAIRRAATFRPDIALLGVVMPEMGGAEAAIRLLEICPGTKIVLVTELVLPTKLEHCTVRAVNSKPYEGLSLPVGGAGQLCA